jgi:N-acetylmuramoyl-L-alanine amidase
MSSQQSSSGAGRQSILQGVYEENLRTKQGKPSPHRAAAQDEAQGEVRRSRLLRWGAAGVLLAFVAATGAAYTTGGTSMLRARLFPSTAGATASAETGAPRLSSRAVSGAGLDRPSLHALPSTLPPRSEPQAGEVSSEPAPSVAGLFGLGVKTVVIDPGHGGKKDGAVGPGGAKEKNVALDVALRLRRRLRARYDYRILLTRTGDRHLSLRERVQFANRREADLFLSIHVNALPDTSVTSVETYYYGQQASEQELRLAERENQSSGYSVAEFNQLLDDVGRRLRREESKRLAGSIQKSLYRNMKEYTPSVRDWGVRTAPFVVLLGVEAPSILAEIGVISNPAEEKKLRRSSYREALARYLEAGVARYLGDAPSADTTALASRPAPGR